MSINFIGGTPLQQQVTTRAHDEATLACVRAVTQSREGQGNFIEWFGPPDSSAKEQVSTIYNGAVAYLRNKDFIYDLRDSNILLEPYVEELYVITQNVQSNQITMIFWEKFWTLYKIESSVAYRALILSIIHEACDQSSDIVNDIYLIDTEDEVKFLAQNSQKDALISALNYTYYTRQFI